MQLQEIQIAYQLCDKPQDALLLYECINKNSLANTERKISALCLAKTHAKYGDNRAALTILKTIDYTSLKSHTIKALYHSVEASIFIAAENPSSAVKHYKEAAENYGKAQITNEQQAQYINIARAYSAYNVFDSAYMYYDSSIMIPFATKRSRLYYYLNLAVTKSSDGDISSAKSNFVYALSILDTLNDLKAKCRTLANLADIYVLQDSLVKAEAYFIDAKNLADSINSTSDLYRINKALSELYEKNKDFEFAYNYLTVADSIHDQMNISTVNSELMKNDLINTRTFNHNNENDKTFNKIWWGVLFLSMFVFSLWVLTPVRRKKTKKRISSDNIQLKKIAKDLENYVLNNKAFTQSDLNLDKVAKKLKTNRTYLSESVNTLYGKSFSQWLNEIRINAAIEILESKDNEKYSIQGIASMVGFSSISSFNANFKAITGSTPSHFRK